MYMQLEASTTGLHTHAHRNTYTHTMQSIHLHRNACVPAHLCTHTYVFYMYTCCTHLHMNARVPRCESTCMYMHAHPHGCICVYTCSECVPKCLDVKACVCTCMHIHMDMHQEKYLRPLSDVCALLPQYQKLEVGEMAEKRS